MAHINYLKRIETSDIAWLGEAPNYQTLMPHGAHFNPMGIEAVDKAELTAADTAAIGATMIELKEQIGNTVGIKAGTALKFGESVAILSAWASPNDMMLKVFPLAAEIAADAAAMFDGIGARPLYSGTAVGRTYAERDAGIPFELAAVGDDELYLVAFTVPDLFVSTEIVLVRHSVRVKENRVPKFTELDAAIQTALRGSYQMYRGT